MTEKIIDTVTSMKDIKNMLIPHVAKTDSCIVHTSLSAFGYIPGGERTIVKALKDIFSEGNIVMAAQTADLSDPAEWGAPPATEQAQMIIKENMVPFDKNETPIHYIGKTPEYFRTSDGVKRTNHPLYSMCAWGRDADHICRNRKYDMPFDWDSPLGDLYKLDAKVIMLGTDYESCTALHLADSTIDRPLLEETAPVKNEKGEREWITFKNVDELDKYDDFNEFGTYFEEHYPEAIVKIPIYKGFVRIIQMRQLVDSAQIYYRKKDLQNK